MNPWDQFTGANAGYVYELFERYQRDPSSVDEATRRAFATWTPSESASAIPATASGADTSVNVQAGIAAFNLAESIRRFGHLAARLDPLGFHDPIGDPSLAPREQNIVRASRKQAIKELLIYVVPLSIVVFSVVGVIFLGVATPTEAAALGALTSLILAAAYRGLTWKRSGSASFSRSPAPAVAYSTMWFRCQRIRS